MRKGSIAERVLAITHLPGRFWAAAAASAPSLTESGRPGEVFGLVDGQELVGLVGQHVLAEVGVELGQPLVDLRHPGLGRRVEAGAGAHEIGVFEPGEALLLGGPLGLVGRVVERFDALEKLLVLGDLVAEGGHLGRHLAFDRLQLGIAHGAAVDPEEGLHPAVALAGALELAEGVLEGRRRRVAGDLLDLGQSLLHRQLERRLEVRHLDLVERREAAIGAGPLGEQGIVLRLGGRRRGAFRALGGSLARRGGAGALRQGQKAGETNRQIQEAGAGKLVHGAGFSESGWMGGGGQQRIHAATLILPSSTRRQAGESATRRAGLKGCLVILESACWGRGVCYSIGMETKTIRESLPGLWELLQAFRAKTDLAYLDVEAVYRDVRDTTPGREVAL